MLNDWQDRNRKAFRPSTQFAIGAIGTLVVLGMLIAAYSAVAGWLSS